MIIDSYQKIANLFFILLFSLQTAQAVELFGSDNPEVIYEVGPNVYVKLIDQDDESYGPNDHPVSLDQDKLIKVLRFLTLKNENAVNSFKVFTESEVNLLSRYLTRALAKSKPDQDVIFALKKSKDRIFGLKDAEYFDAGRIFYKAGNLNIIFGDYDKPRLDGVEQTYDPTRMGITRYFFKHGSRKRSESKVQVDLDATSGVDISRIKNKKRVDWLVIDIEQAAIAYESEVENANKSELERRRAELRELFGDSLGQTSEEERVRQQKDNLERRKLREEMARMRKDMKEGNQQGTTVEARLVRLKKLKEQNLISHEEYVVQRQKILEEL